MSDSDFETGILQAIQACKAENLEHLAYGAKHAARVYLTLAKKTLDDPSVLQRLSWFLELPTEVQQNLMNPKVTTQPTPSYRKLKVMFGKPELLGVVTVPESFRQDAITYAGFLNDMGDSYLCGSAGSRSHIDGFYNPSCVLTPGQRFSVTSYRLITGQSLTPKLAAVFLALRGHTLLGLWGAILTQQQLDRSLILDGSGERDGTLFLDHECCLPRDRGGNFRVATICRHCKGNIGGFWWSELDSPNIMATYQVVGFDPLM